MERGNFHGQQHIKFTSSLPGFGQVLVKVLGSERARLGRCETPHAISGGASKPWSLSIQETAPCLTCRLNTLLTGG